MKVELLTVISLADLTKPGRVSFGLILLIFLLDQSSNGILGSARSPCFPARRLMMLPHQTMTIPEVCIAEAGMAGLRCAELLIRGGLPVTMFEARDRVSGRVSFPRVNRYEAD